MTAPQPGRMSVPLPPATSVLARLPLPAICAITGTRHASGALSVRSGANSACASGTVVAPLRHTGSPTLMSGTPGCRVKSLAIAVTGLPAAFSICFHRSSDAVLPYACAAM